MNNQVSLESFIKDIPKAELHLHIEGTFEPELMFEIARRNNRKLVFRPRTYDFKSLPDFLNIYYKGVYLLMREQDFYDLTLAYLRKAHSQKVLHAEVFFDPQAHTMRPPPFASVDFKTVITGIHRALADAEEELGISTGLIMCFHRDKDPTFAMETLEEALPYKSWIVAVGLDSYEKGNPPSKFQTVFDRAYEEGFKRVAHAGEDGPAEYIWQAIDLLKVSRIDHGIRSLDDKNLVQELKRRKIPLTVCPLSNLKLRVIDRMEDHPLKKLMEKGLRVTINSDDPAYFGGYINENYLVAQEALKLDKEDIYKIAKNSFEASFIDAPRKEQMIAKLDDYMSRSGRVDNNES